MDFLSKTFHQMPDEVLNIYNTAWCFKDNELRADIVKLESWFPPVYNMIICTSCIISHSASRIAYPSSFTDQQRYRTNFLKSSWPVYSFTNLGAENLNKEKGHRPVSANLIMVLRTQPNLRSGFLYVECNHLKFWLW